MRHSDWNPDDAKRDSQRQEIARQVEEFLRRGGEIQQLDGPHLQCPKSVQAGVPAVDEF